MIQRSYPHDEFKQNDNSSYDLTISNSVTGKFFLQAMLAGKGRDNTLLTFDGADAYSKFYEEFGLGSFKEHGQSILNIERMLKSGAKGHVIRVMPDDATLSNVMLIAHTKVLTAVPKKNAEGKPLFLTPQGTEVIASEGNTAIVRDVVSVKLSTKTVTGAKDMDDIETAMSSEYKSVADTDGFKAFPILAITPTGRGKYGNKLHFRITRNAVAEKARYFRTYNLESYIDEGSLLKLDDPYIASLYDGAIYNDIQEYMEQIVADYSTNYRLAISENYYDLLVAEIIKTIPAMTEETLDVLFCTDKATGAQHYQMELAAESADLTSVNGIALENGSDGSFELSSEGRDVAIKAALLSAYTGKTDDAVFNVTAKPTDIIMDANFPLEVKMAIVGLKSKRTDCVAILDAGVQFTGTSLLEWRKGSLPVDEFDTFIYGESGKVRDLISKKNIHVTETYMLSTDFIQHIIGKGTHIPFAGLEVGGRASSYLTGTQTPVINDTTMQDSLFENGVNITEYYKEVRLRETEATSQYKNSDLRFIHNVMVAKELKRDLENLVKTKRYKFTDGDGITAFSKDGNDLITRNYMMEGKLNSATLRIEQTEQEKRAKIVRWVVDIKFRDFVLYNVIELNIN